MIIERYACNYHQTNKQTKKFKDLKTDRCIKLLLSNFCIITIVILDDACMKGKDKQKKKQKKKQMSFSDVLSYIFSYTNTYHKNNVLTLCKYEALFFTIVLPIL